MKEKGITLIALVITIIVMLILVGVTINIVINGGLFEYAQKANDEKIIADEKEQISLAYFNAKMKKLGGEVDEGDFQTALDDQVGKDKTQVSLNDEEKIKIFFTDTKNTYVIEGENIIKQEPLELHITNYEELYAFAQRVNNGEDFKDYIVYLDNDIEMEGDDWISIGTPGDRDNLPNSFCGVFEGNKHKIANFLLQNAKRYNGLFCQNHGTIQNLKIEGEVLGNAGNCVGVIAGANYGTIENSTVMINCDISSVSTGNYSLRFGGIAGYSLGKIKGCKILGEIKTSGADHSATGGIVGIGSGEILNCENNAEINGGTQYIGGIIGNTDMYVVSVEKCVNNAKIIVNENDPKYSYGGGIAGTISADDSKIEMCSNKGEIRIDSYEMNASVGGILGDTQRKYNNKKLL